MLQDADNEPRRPQQLLPMPEDQHDPRGCRLLFIAAAVVDALIIAAVIWARHK